MIGLPESITKKFKRFANPGAQFPNHFVVDLGQPVKVSYYGMLLYPWIWCADQRVFLESKGSIADCWCAHYYVSAAY